MESSVRDKGTSVDVAGSDNSTLVVDTRGKRKMDPLDGSSLKRICAPSEDSSDDLLPATSDDLYHPPPQVQSVGPINHAIDEGGVVRYSVADSGKHIAESESDSDSETYTNAADALSADCLRRRRNRAKPWPQRKPTPEQWDLYEKQLEASEKFYVDYFLRIKFSYCGSLSPCCPLSDMAEHKFYENFKPLAAKFLYAGSEMQLDDFQVVQAVHEGSGRASYYYITFIAKGSLDNVVRCYEAKACRLHIYEHQRHTYEDSVMFARLRDERGHLTAEDVSKQSCDEDSLVQLYMDEFCPIQPVNEERKEVTDRSMFKYYVQLAADKASEDLDLGGKKLQCLKLEEAYEQVFCFTVNYYITFEGSLDGERRSYGAKVIETFYDKSKRPCWKVESVWQKDDPNYLTVEQRINKRKVKEDQKCFDGDCRHEQTSHMKNIPGVIMSVDPETLKGEEYKKFKPKIVRAVANGSGGKKKLQDLEIEKANQQSFGDTKHHYITFTAKDDDGECRCFYRAKVTCCPCEYEVETGSVDEDDECETESDDEGEWSIVQFVSQKDDNGGHSQVTIELVG